MRRWILGSGMVVLAGVCLAAFGQQPKAPAGGPPAMVPRPLAPGVMLSVDPDREVKESVSRHDVVELLAVDPKYDWAKDIAFRHDVWTLDFKFKPVRMIWVDVPQASGKMQRQLIWYMVYSVRNTGKVMHPVEDAALPYQTFEGRKLYEVKFEDRPLRFLPEFLLEGRRGMKTDSGPVSVYRDRVIPVAVGPIATREDPSRQFLTTVEMCGREINVGETLWGVVTWEYVDPEIHRFSVYVKGLTNAYRWRDDPGTYKKGDEPGTGRRLYQKTLKLNFWRPADAYFEHEEEIRFGVPGERDRDYEWVYLASPPQQRSEPAGQPAGPPAAPAGARP